MFALGSKIMVLLLCLLVVVTTLAQESYYDRRYDYYDIDNLIHNPRLLKKYLDCFLEQGPCTPIGRVFRQIMPEIVATACERCSPSQRRLTHKAFKAFRTYFPESHNELKKKLDPDDKYFEAFQEAVTNA